MVISRRVIIIGIVLILLISSENNIRNNILKKCKECDSPLTRLTDEVDIGVGNQEFTIGYECSNCGQQYGVCSTCGTIEDDNHEDWCSSLRYGVG